MKGTQPTKDIYFVENAASNSYIDIGEQLEQDQQKSSELHTLVETTKFQSATLPMQQSDKEEYLRALAA